MTKYKSTSELLTLFDSLLEKSEMLTARSLHRVIEKPLPILARGESWFHKVEIIHTRDTLDSLKSNHIAHNQTKGIQPRLDLRFVGFFDSVEAHRPCR
jgi:hypothetical protein